MIDSPFDKPFYALAEAAFRLMLSEDEILKKAANGRMRLYIDAAGVSGKWRRRAPDGRIGESLVRTMPSGYLRLRRRACQELADTGQATVKTLEMCSVVGHEQANIQEELLVDLWGWGPGDKQFFPEPPIVVDKHMLILLPPLR